jgi:hypothetical protein
MAIERGSPMRLLESIVSGVAIVAGVVLAERLRRRADRRVDTENAGRELAMLLPYVLLGMSNSKNPVDTSMESLWWQRRERVMTLFNLIASSPRQKFGQGKRIRAEANELHAKVTAIEMNFLTKGKRINTELTFEITTAELMTVLFTNRKVLDEKVQHYRSLYDPNGS